MNQSLPAVLGGRPVVIHWAPVGEFGDIDFKEWALACVDRLYGLDVETTYMNDLGQWSPDFAIRLIQFATETSAWVLNIADPSQASAAEWLLSDLGAQFCSHTSMDVLSAFLVLGVDITDRNTDTRMLGRLVDGSQEAQNDLKHLATEHGLPELERAESALLEHFRELWTGKANAARKLVHSHGWSAVDVQDQRYLTYAGLDAMACRQLAPVLALESNVPNSLVTTEIWLARKATQIQLRGMRVDQELLAELEHEAKRETSAAEAIVKEVTEGIPARSPKIKDWLAGNGVDWSQWQGNLTPTGAPSLSKGSTGLLLAHDLTAAGRAVVEALVTFKAHQDALLKTKGVREHLAADGRVHPSLNTLGAVTGRMSSSAPNFQNFSKVDPRMRGLFLAEPGYVLVTADFDQVELRVVAALAREQKMIDTILAGGDLHQLTVDEIGQLGITITRAIGKMTNFLIVYGGGGKALHEQAGIPIELAKRIVAAHRDRYQAIGELNAQLSRNHDAIRTISGRLIKVKRWPDGRTASYANINYLVQSSARDLLVDAWLKLEHIFGRSHAVWFPIHDELVLQVPENDLETVMADVERAMTMDFLGVPISAGAKVLRDENGVSRWGKG